MSKWESMVIDLQDDQQIHVLRNILCDVSQKVDSYSLIGFCDASKMVYATEVYLEKTRRTPCEVPYQSQSPATTDHSKTETLVNSVVNMLFVSVKKGLELRLPV